MKSQLSWKDKRSKMAGQNLACCAKRKRSPSVLYSLAKDIQHTKLFRSIALVMNGPQRQIAQGRSFAEDFTWGHGALGEGA